ncbi:MAG: hypothetical protein VXX85_01455 [Candidatus Margulisiibacteriota bacterium]|nr:hypothetical protein [Candidatus Margulisiibacteriota bacterium]
MDKKHLFILNHIITFGELFFFSTEGFKKDQETANQLFADLYKNVSFN